jgi:hypothetical protein
MSELMQDTDEDKLLRAMCVVFVSMMPASGLPETFESLQQIYAFWHQNQSAPTKQKSLPQSITLSNLEQTIRREVMIPEEDE